jgi:hypothetical protein
MPLEAFPEAEVGADGVEDAVVEDDGGLACAEAAGAAEASVEASADFA